MPNVIVREWQEFKVGLRPEGFVRDTLLYIRHHSLLPYFYGTFVNLDLIIGLPKNIQSSEVIKYEWFLSCENNEEITKDTEVFTRGQGSIDVGAIYSRYKRKHFWNTNKLISEFRKQGLLVSEADTPEGSKIFIRKQQAIKLGLLTFPDRYKIKLRLTNNANVTSEYMTVAEFVLKDRDDYYLTIFYSLLGAILTIAGGVIGAIITYVVLRR